MRVQCIRHVGGDLDDCGWGQAVADATPRYAADTLFGRCPVCGSQTEAVVETWPRITLIDMPFCLISPGVDYRDMLGFEGDDT